MRCPDFRDLKHQKSYDESRLEGLPLKYYTINCCVLQAILDVVVNLQFQMVENLWHHFWADPKSSM